MKLSIKKYFSKIWTRNFDHYEEFRQSYSRPGPFTAIPSICSQRSLIQSTYHLMRKLLKISFIHFSGIPIIWESTHVQAVNWDPKIWNVSGVEWNLITKGNFYTYFYWFSMTQKGMILMIYLIFPKVVRKTFLTKAQGGPTRIRRLTSLQMWTWTLWGALFDWD